MRTYTAAFLAFLMISLAVAETADAQSIRERARRAAERGAERAVEREAEQRADRAVTGAIECLFGDRECAQRAEAEGKEVTYVDEAGEPVDPTAQPAADALPATPAGDVADPNDQVWVNYDFVPGDRVIFFEDFSADRVGDFPRRLEFQRGNMEVAEWRGQRWLRSTTIGSFVINLPEVLPERFTVELEFADNMGWLHFNGQQGGQSVQFWPGTAGITTVAQMTVRDIDDGPQTLRVMADGRYAKVYLNETRVANVPNSELGRSNQVIVRLQSSERRPTMLTNIRIAAGGSELYDALTADGRVVSRGILFDTGSDRIRPESARTLKEIGEMLQQHGDLRLMIEGHTDSVGSAEANQQLSERRANSVRQYLVQHYQIDDERLQAAGLGEAQPIDSNDTAEGRQNNRRVELVRL